MLPDMGGVSVGGAAKGGSLCWLAAVRPRRPLPVLAGASLWLVQWCDSQVERHVRSVGWFEWVVVVHEVSAFFEVPRNGE